MHVHKFTFKGKYSLPLSVEC